jgi:hypothetical protein
MTAHDRAPRLGDIVLYHEQVIEAIFDPPRHVAWPAIVTGEVPEREAGAGPTLRLTVFRPYDRPLWDVTAPFAEAPERGCWTWRDPVPSATGSATSP